MKTRKTFTVFLTAAALLLVLGSCSSDSSSGGGSGAEFDASLYYTKTEIDSKLLDINAVLTNDYYTKTQVNGRVMPVPGTSQNISSTGYANRITISMTLDGKVKKGVLLKIYNPKDQPNSISIGTSETTFDVYQSINAGGNTLAYYFSNDASEIYVWANAINGGGSPISVLPQVFFE
jgi:hypothetical protein